MTVTDFLNALKETSFSGDVTSRLADRLVLSTDNSIYRIIPQAVLFPKTEQDVAEVFTLAARSEFNSITFVPRGGGTGTNGQSLTDAVVIDCSRYLTDILEINIPQMWVRVQPGVVLDQLNDVLKPFGVFFAPSLAPSNRATIGGMIATDACGKGSRLYGRTSNHCLSLNLVLPDGTLISLREEEMAAASENNTARLKEIYGELASLLIPNRESYKQVDLNLSRAATGYNLLHAVSPDKTKWQLPYLIAGSEGTLGVVTEATLKLTKIPAHKILLVLNYDTFDHALSHGHALLRSQPAAIETLDGTILALARNDIIFDKVKSHIPPDSGALNLVEFCGDDPTALKDNVRRILQEYKETYVLAAYCLENDEAQRHMWNLRKKGVGLLGKKSGRRKPIPFIEDTLVPPDKLTEYVQALRRLLDSFGLEYGMFGHIDVGCLHVRPALDISSPGDETLIRVISDKTVGILKQFGGMIWGEHGKGFRGEYTEVFFGKAYYADMCRVKEIFDPHNKLNPGKVAVPYSLSGPLIPLDAPETQGELIRRLPEEVRHRFSPVLDCNGNGQCFDYYRHHAMCPTYRATSDRIHSPKGRAEILKQWLHFSIGSGKRNKFTSGQDEADLYLQNNDRENNLDFDFQAFNALDGCIGCKACATHCPLQVNIPEYKSLFLHAFYMHRSRSLRDRLVKRLETTFFLQSTFPKFTNLLMHNPVSRKALKRIAGLVDLPKAATPALRKRLPVRPVRLSAIGPDSVQPHTVFLLQDMFTSLYEKNLLPTTYHLLTALGADVRILPFLPTGKALHVKGYLKEFEKMVRATIKSLSVVSKLNAPIVALEPSIALLFRDEYKKMNIPANTVAVSLIQEWLISFLKKLPVIKTNGRSAHFALFGHCMEHALTPGAQAQWQQIFNHFGYQVSIVETSCCGMAGIFGHEKHHKAESKTIYQLSWDPLINRFNTNDITIMATGYSCRSQVNRFHHFRPDHPLESLWKNLIKDNIIRVP